MSRPFRYFPSHSFKYNRHHDAFQDLLEAGAPTGVSCHSFAPTAEHPVHASGDNIFLANQLMARIAKVDIVLALAGVYASHSDWMSFEITVAALLNKPIIAVAPNGQERLSAAVMKHAENEALRWRSDSVWSAVQQSLPTSRWAELTPPRRVWV